MQEENTEVNSNQKRERSPSFPYIDLMSAVDLLRKLFNAAKLNEMRLSDIANEWGMSAKSGSFTRYVSALTQFELIEANGTGDSRRIKVSSEGRRILDDNREGIFENLLSDAAIKPKLIQGLYLGTEEYPKWGHDRPKDNIAISALVFDMNFSKEAARRFLAVYDETIKCVIRVGNDGTVAGSADTDATELNIGLVNEPGTEVDKKKDTTLDQNQLPPNVAELNSINFKSDGDGIITITAKLDSTGLELLEKKIAAFKILLS
jgi:hypothetical protein